ncbi:MAG: hypothetical protein H3C39_07785 [Flavobacteriia bacterium]|nr:hypothetical protein [Flavobacteriia bacterium]
MYLIKANFYDDFYIYKDGILIMTATRKYIWFAGVKIQVFSKENELLLSYRYFNFFISFIKIKYQKLPEKIELMRNKWRNIWININNQRIDLKFNFPLQKKMAIIKINGENSAIVRQKVISSDLNYEIEFHKESELEIYCILFFLMNISTIESL